MDKKVSPTRKPMIARITLAIMAVFIASLILLQILFIGGMAWINMSSGQGWIERHVAAATGYQVAVKKISLIGLRMLEIGDITLSDKDGAFLQAHDVFMALDVPGLLARHLNISLRAESLALNRVPQAGAPKPGGGPLMTPFVLPDFYIRQVNLEGLNIAHLSLSKAVAGQDLNLAPDITASIVRDRNHFLVKLKASPGSGAPALFPRAVAFNGAIDTDQALISIDSLDVQSEAYHLTAQGQAGLGDQGIAALRLTGDVQDLTTLSASVPGTVHVQGTVSGLSNDPDLSLQSTARLAAYTAKGLEDVQGNLQIHHALGKPQGLAELKTVFQKRAVAANTAFLLDGANLSLTDVKGAATDFSLQGNLVLNTATLQAQGHLQAQIDAAAYKDLAGVDVAGKIKAAVTVSVKDGAQSVAMISSIINPRFQTLRADSFNLDFDIADTRTLWPDHANIVLRGGDLPGLALHKMDISLVRRGDDYALTLAGQGRAQKPFSLAGSALLSGRSVADAALHDADFRVSSGKGTLSLKGDLLPDHVDFNLAGSAFPLNALLVSADALISGKAALTGPLAAPVFKADMLLKPTKTIARGSQLTVAAHYQDKNISATLNGAGKGIHKLAGQMTLPGQFSLRPFLIDLPASTPLKGGLNADLDLGILSFFVPPDMVVAGNAQAAITIAGTLNKPDANGTASLLRGSFEQISSGVVLTGITAKASFKNDRLAINSFQAGDSIGGSLRGDGDLTLDAEKHADVTIKAQNLNPFRNNTMISGPVSGDVRMSGTLNHYVLKGTMQTGAMNITIPERFSGAIPRLNIVQKKSPGLAPGNPLEGVALDIAIHTPNQIFVRGWGLDAEFGGDLQVGGTLSAPLVNGTLDSKRGRYEQFGKRFDITQGHLRFQGAVPPSPYLDITAQTVTEDNITAIVTLTGAVNGPTVKLSSTPALPDDEVLSRILFGKEISKISPFQAIQIAQTLRQFSGKGGGGGLDPLGMLRSATHLDDLEVNTSESGETTVGAGKYLTDKVYVSVESGADEKSSVGKVQIDVAPHVKVETKVGQEAQTGGGILWQWDY